MERQTDRWRDRQMKRQTFVQIGRWTSEQMNMEGRPYGHTGKWTDGRIDRWTNGQMNR
jgi:hypothetical protein